MARLRYNGLVATLNGDLTATATGIGFQAALTHSNGVAVPTVASPDYIPLSIVDAAGHVTEIIYLTAYTSGATTGTVTRGQESTTAVAHTSGDSISHSPTVRDIGGDAAWTTPTLQNGWVNYGGGFSTPGFRKMGNGNVLLKGTVKSGTMGAAIFTLPTGYRPSGTTIFPVSAGGAFGQLTVNTDGTVVLNSGGNGGHGMDGLNFYIGD